MKGLKILLVLIDMALTLCACHSSAALHPLILVPGNGGNQLEARLTGAFKSSSLLCYQPFLHHKEEDKSDWFRLWFDPKILLSPFTRCFAQQMTLYYDPDKDDYHNGPGVETRVPFFGSTQSLAYLDPNLKHITSYMANLVKSLEQIGYIDGVNLFGAPYDFRYGLAAEGHPSFVGSRFLHDLKELIENASATNGGKPVIIMSHSLGGLFVLNLLNRNPLSWRRRYVKHFVALSAPWGGTVEEILTFASGYTLRVPFIDPLLVREEQRTSESNLWLLPSPKIFGQMKLLVITQNATYSASDIPRFLEDIGFPQGVQPYKSRILPLIEHEQLIAPEVAVTCIIGYGVETPETLFYGSEGFDKQPEVVYGDGDGTVNMVSLLAVEAKWADTAEQPLKVIRIPGVSHTGILNDIVALEKIITEISDINSVVTGSVA
ncbi:PREDICTED: lecithin-cholesterol acyltransferase-like 1 [Nelumbo nucifera]|uniref:Lecithin-cholesterol acyltransferase-like 1 n=2 Tax=Nelumbo nucifera TaxID=4432 RepID=A0A822ZIM3_NELNU|nr:PREDICTED: lecithin-cholesterol acyltransferase-like 1 [Nelumbo nucifera]DAD41548.1 TPA_asm: hypothetical protein HUJ06_015871 [Nelumbo nucifera]